MEKKVGELLRGISRYPVAETFLAEVALRRGLDLDAVADGGIVDGSAYRLAKADLLVWLAKAPNTSQGGQSYSFSSEERKEMLKSAKGTYKQIGQDLPEGLGEGVTYGYKGSRL